MTGINVLKTDLLISQSAEGAKYQVGEMFEEVIDPESLLLAGDFDADGNVDGADFLEWQRGVGSDNQANELANWQANYGANSGMFSGLQSVPEPVGVCLCAIGFLFSHLALRQRSTSCNDRHNASDLPATVPLYTTRRRL